MQSSLRIRSGSASGGRDASTSTRRANVSLPISSPVFEGPACGAGSLREARPSRELRTAPGAGDRWDMLRPVSMRLDALLDLDRELFLLVNRVQGAVWDIGFGYGTWLGAGAVVLLLLGLGLRAFDRRRFPKNLLIMATAIGIASCTNASLKDWVGRPRPLRDAEFAASRRPSRVHLLPGGLPVAEYAIRDPHWSRLAPAVKGIGERHSNQSFPSGHTAVAFAAATALVYSFRSRRRYLFLLPAGFVGLSRIACGAHYPLDVAVGGMIGAGVCFGLLRAFESFHGLASRPAAEPRARLPAGRGPRVMMVAGEASADVYGARILEQLRELDPRTQAFGIGGEQLRRAGLRLHGEAHQLAIVGFTAVLGRLLPVIRLYRRLLRLLRHEPPDVLVCIDLPDFNLMLASQARARGIPVLFDISPQFWAWRPGRVDKIAGRISKMIVAFPFEVPFYQRAGVPVAFHGHPLLEGLARRFPARDAALRHFGLDPERRTLVLAPGSRRERDRAPRARALRRRGAPRARSIRAGSSPCRSRRRSTRSRSRAPRAGPASRSSAPAATSSICSPLRTSGSFARER